MVFLKTFSLLNEDKEFDLLCDKKNIYTSVYPFHIFPEKNFEKIEFEPITIFYGGNGSGKTTLLNIISQKLRASKKNINNKGELFEQYVKKVEETIISNDYELKEIKMISSDDVFDYLLDLRAINTGVNRRKENLEEEYYKSKYNSCKATLETYDELKKNVEANKMTVSKYIRTKLGKNNIEEHSNGESALEFWENEIKDHAIYLLDEPENSLSAENQIKLANFIEESARFYDCQFIISTHSPFLLSMKGAKIYDLDIVPVVSKKWTELKNVRAYYEFFKEHDDEF